MEISLLAALAGGVLTQFSPCGALLLPAFLASSLDGAGRILTRVMMVLLGALTVLLPLGAAAGALGGLLLHYQQQLLTLGGWLLIGLGLWTALGGRAGAVRMPRAATVRTVAGAYLLGMVYALAGTCVGPILGAVLTTAATTGSPVRGVLVTVAYGVGMVLPLGVLALLWERLALGSRQWLRGRPLQWGPVQVQSTQLLSGLLIIALGVVFLATRGTAALPGWFTADEHVTAQVTLQRILADVDPVLLLVGGVLVVNLLVLAVVWLRSRRRTTPTTLQVGEYTIITAPRMIEL